MGYATGQFGKNHLGDLNKYLPTVHGFDEFFGNLYHLNAEEEPENPDYPEPGGVPAAVRPGPPARGPALLGDRRGRRRVGPAGTGHWASSGSRTPARSPQKRMETIDDETTDACVDFIRRQHDSEKPFFAWMNMTHMHVYTHTRRRAKVRRAAGSRRTTTR